MNIDLRIIADLHDQCCGRETCDLRDLCEGALHHAVSRGKPPRENRAPTIPNRKLPLRLLLSASEKQCGSSQNCEAPDDRREWDVFLLVGGGMNRAHIQNRFAMRVIDALV